MIYVQNDDGEMEQMHIDPPTVGEVIAEGDDTAEQGMELREILIPKPRELLFVDKPHLAEATFEKTPTVIKVSRLTFEHKKQEKKQQKKKWGKRGGSMHAWDSPVDDLDSVDSMHDYSGSECQMLDEHGQPWPQGYIKVDMYDGTIGRMKVSDFEGVDCRPKRKLKMHAQQVEAEDWDEDVRQMELDEA